MRTYTGTGDPMTGVGPTRHLVPSLLPTRIGFASKGHGALRVTSPADSSIFVVFINTSSVRIKCMAHAWVSARPSDDDDDAIWLDPGARGYISFSTTPLIAAHHTWNLSLEIREDWWDAYVGKSHPISADVDIRAELATFAGAAAVPSK
jgi:hypothetical protein